MIERQVDRGRAARRDRRPSSGEQKCYMDGRDVTAQDLRPLEAGAGNRIAGPAIVIEMDSTTVILPKHHGRVDAYGNILIYPGRSTRRRQKPRRRAGRPARARRKASKRAVRKVARKARQARTCHPLIRSHTHARQDHPEEPQADEEGQGRLASRSTSSRARCATRATRWTPCCSAPRCRPASASSTTSSR